MNNETSPIEIFKSWYKTASPCFIGRWLRRLYPPLSLHQPDAMTLATASKEGFPSARMVLFKGLNEDGFIFYTNYKSRKGQELTENPRAAALFHWSFPERQVRLEGKVILLSEENSIKYWRSRPRNSQISAIVSPQSTIIENRSLLQKWVKEAENKYRGIEIPKPLHWGGYVIVPDKIEFWEMKIFRLHSRTVYTKKDNHWHKVTLAP